MACACMHAFVRATRLPAQRHVTLPGCRLRFWQQQYAGDASTSSSGGFQPLRLSLPLHSPPHTSRARGGGAAAALSARSASSGAPPLLPALPPAWQHDSVQGGVGPHAQDRHSSRADHAPPPGGQQQQLLWPLLDPSQDAKQQRSSGGVFAAASGLRRYNLHAPAPAPARVVSPVPAPGQLAPAAASGGSRRHQKVQRSHEAHGSSGSRGMPAQQLQGQQQQLPPSALDVLRQARQHAAIGKPAGPPTTQSRPPPHPQQHYPRQPVLAWPEALPPPQQLVKQQQLVAAYGSAAPHRVRCHRHACGSSLVLSP